MCKSKLQLEKMDRYIVPGHQVSGLMETIVMATRLTSLANDLRQWAMRSVNSTMETDWIGVQFSCCLLQC